MAGISSLGNYQQTSTVDSWINSYMNVERKPVNNLESEKSNLNKQKAVYTDLKSKLSTLRNRVKSFKEVGSKAIIGAKTVESSNTSIISADANATAKLGVSTVHVSQLAKFDIAVSDKINAKSSNLVKSAKGKSYSMTIKVGSEKTKDITVKIDDDIEDNGDILDQLVKSINDSGLDVSAKILEVSKNNSRITVTSNEAGEENAISFDGDKRLLQALGFYNGNGEDRREATKTKGGYLESEIENLNSQFSVNGIDITRNSNTVDDVLTGVTLNLHSVHEKEDEEATITVSSDSENLKTEIESFINEYNEVVKYLNEKSGIDTSTYTRGALTGDNTTRSMKINLRLKISENVSGVKDDYNRLNKIGIEFETDGTLKVADKDKFEDALADNAEDVEKLFNSDEGIAKKVDDFLDRYTRTGGVIDDSGKGIGRKITNIEKRIKSYEGRLSIRAGNLRRQFSDIQRTLSKLNSQQTMISRSMSYMNNFNYINSSYQL